MILNIYNSTVRVLFSLSSFNLNGPWYTTLITLCVCCCLVSQSCPTLCDPVDCSMPGLPVHHHLQELAQTHVHWIRDAIQPLGPRSFSSPPGSIFPSIRVFSNESAFPIRWPKYWSFSFRSVLTINIRDWFPLGLTGLISLQSNTLSRVFFNTTVEKHQFFST